MSAWNDPGRWSKLCSGEACPICRQTVRPDFVASLESSWLAMPQSAAVRGYVCLVSQTHAVELHDLPEATCAAFMRDVRHVSRALLAATGAVKLNYEIHGNTIPHVHLHFFPRYRGDRFEGRPIDPRIVTAPVYARGEFETIRDAIVRALGSRES